MPLHEIRTSDDVGRHELGVTSFRPCSPPLTRGVDGIHVERGEQRERVGRGCPWFRSEDDHPQVCAINGEHIAVEFYRTEFRVLDGLVYVVQHLDVVGVPQVAEPIAGRAQIGNEPSHPGCTPPSPRAHPNQPGVSSRAWRPSVTHCAA